MTIDEAIIVLQMVQAYGLAEEAKQTAIQALKQIKQIKTIIDDTRYKDDVIRYVMIRDLIK